MILHIEDDFPFPQVGYVNLQGSNCFFFAFLHQFHQKKGLRIYLAFLRVWSLLNMIILVIQTQLLTFLGKPFVVPNNELNIQGSCMLF